MAKFWNFSVDPENINIGRLNLSGDISDVSWAGDEVTPRMFKQELDDLGEIDELEIHINSGGGDVFAGQAIYNMIKSAKAHKTVYIDGLAASIASVIAMAGEKIVMPANALMMIHEAWTIAAGNKHDLRKQARTLDVIDETIRGVYTARTGLEDDQVARMMAAETWMTAREAFEMGFCTNIEENQQIAASVNSDKAIINGVEIDLNRYHNAGKLTGDAFDAEDEKRRNAPPSEEYPAHADEGSEEEEEESEEKDHSNGADQQPVDDIHKKLIERRARLIALYED